MTNTTMFFIFIGAVFIALVIYIISKRVVIELGDWVRVLPPQEYAEFLKERRDYTDRIGVVLALHYTKFFGVLYEVWFPNTGVVPEYCFEGIELEKLKNSDLLKLYCGGEK